MAKKKLNPLELVQGVLNGRPLTAREMGSLFSFAMDNLISFTDEPEIWEIVFKDVVQRKLKHFSNTAIKEQAAAHLAFCKNQE